MILVLLWGAPVAIVAAEAVNLVFLEMKTNRCGRLNCTETGSRRGVSLNAIVTGLIIFVVITKNKDSIYKTRPAQSRPNYSGGFSCHFLGA